MLSKTKIKFLNSLKLKKFRDEAGLFVAEGTKIVPELVDSFISVKEIYASASYLQDHTIPAGIEVTEVKANELERISQLSTPNEVLAVCAMPLHNLDEQVISKNLNLVLDDIKDPGNLGTIIRIADWFGIGDIICSMETVDAYNPKVVQSTMGSIGRIRIHYTDLTEFLERQKSASFPVYGAVLGGENIYSKDLRNAGFLVIGNESKGISEKIQNLLTDKISIPSFSHFRQGRGEAESLNAAVAASIICSEFRRR